MDSETIGRLIETSALENILSRPELNIHLDGVNNDTRDDGLNKLGNVCQKLKPTSTNLSRSSIIVALTDMESRRLAKLQHLAQLKSDVNAVSDGRVTLSSVQQDILELTHELDLRATELEQQVSVDSAYMNTMDREILQSDVARLNECAEKSDIKLVNTAMIKNDYNEYLELVAKARICADRISTIPVPCEVCLEKKSLVTHLKLRKDYLNQVVGEVYEKSSS